MSALTETSTSLTDVKEITISSSHLTNLIFQEIENQKERQKTIQVQLQAFAAKQKLREELSKTNSNLKNRILALESAQKQKQAIQAAQEKANKELLATHIQTNNNLRTQIANLNNSNCGYAQTENAINQAAQQAAAAKAAWEACSSGENYRSENSH